MSALDNQSFFFLVCLNPILGAGIMMLYTKQGSEKAHSAFFVYDLPLTHATQITVQHSQHMSSRNHMHQSFGYQFFCVKSAKQLIEWNEESGMHFCNAFFYAAGRD